MFSDEVGARATRFSFCPQNVAQKLEENQSLF
jgi:hypothetical protein